MGRLGLSNCETPAIVDVVTQEEFHVQGVRTALEAMNAPPAVVRILRGCFRAR